MNNFSLLFICFYVSAVLILQSNAFLLQKSQILQNKNQLFSQKRSFNDDKGKIRRTPSVRSPRSIQTDTIRQLRFSRNLRDELSDIITSSDIKANNYPEERLLRGTSIIDIEVSSDLTNVKVTLSVLGNSVEKRQVYVWLNENVGQVRYSLAKRIRNVRRIPTLSFKLMDPQTTEILAIIEEESIKRENLMKKITNNEIEFEEDE